MAFFCAGEALSNTFNKWKVQAKQHLWESIGITLEKSGSDSCKRWGYVRDYYIRRRGKPGSGSSGFAAKKRSG
ncbi:hypothetical protein TNCT_432951 [Trichonephila clavata]|uniref:MADF domain-containing protein n=1 Tax=Trichonephila clavata TaxID=2740835 RepID=A0A8X6LY79_TRICU|nr:hypothetical protein TNCT_432951 [Trichonephila clavata]